MNLHPDLVAVDWTVLEAQTKAAVRRSRAAALLIGSSAVPGPCWPARRVLPTRVLGRSHGKGKLINYLPLSASLPSSRHTLPSLPARLIPLLSLNEPHFSCSLSTSLPPLISILSYLSFFFLLLFKLTQFLPTSPPFV